MIKYSAEDVLTLAKRYKNTKRQYLLVDPLQGKHLPVEPEKALEMFRSLGLELAEKYPDTKLIIGFAETATAVGAGVSTCFENCMYIHTTREEIPEVESWAEFLEEHSHAAEQKLCAEHLGEWIDHTGTVIFVDDEISTGKTLINIVAQMKAMFPALSGKRIVAASIINRVSEENTARLLENGILSECLVKIPNTDFTEAVSGIEVSAAVRYGTMPGTEEDPPYGEIFPEILLPDPRRGMSIRFYERRMSLLADEVVSLLENENKVFGDCLVLGTEECMYPALAIGDRMKEHGIAESVQMHATTRSSIGISDREGYPIRSGFALNSFYEEGRQTFIYNLRKRDLVLIVTDAKGTGAPDHSDSSNRTEEMPVRTGGSRIGDEKCGNSDTLTGNLSAGDLKHEEDGGNTEYSQRPEEELALICRELGCQDVRIVRIGTDTCREFGTFSKEDVELLLKDITGLVEPQSTSEREALIQSGRHYCEMLPIEYVPTEEYMSSFFSAMDRYGKMTADAVAKLAERIVREKGRDACLVSLARAGTAIGVLLVRYIRKKYGFESAHYSISIIRGRGIDENAMKFILRHHSPQSIQFIDGWTGKGAITRQLELAMKDFPGVSPGLGVLSDPAGVAALCGTRDDFLIASSLLNSTVSGLLSRTFLRADIIGPSDYHGAAYYRELKEKDLTETFLGSVEKYWENIRPVGFGWETGEEPDPSEKENGQKEERPAEKSALGEVREICKTFGISDVNLVKPSIGEATRVLLRRLPWKVLVHSLEDEEHLGHLYQLAAEKGVPCEVYPLVHYRACGIIKSLADT